MSLKLTIPTNFALQNSNIFSEMEKYYPQLKKTVKIKNFHRDKFFDFYESLAFEYFLVNNPKSYYAAPEEQKKEFRKVESAHGTWVTHPWDGSAYHLLKQDQYLQLRTARHQGLITNKEQLRLYNTKIAIAGLSVGSNVLTAMVRYGIGNHYVVADADEVTVSNMNRALYSLIDLKKKKTEVVIRSIHSIDPFIKVDAYDEGLTEKSLPQFLRGATLVIDTFDHFPLKIALRKLAKQMKLPVISGFDVEKGILLIVERYDTEASLDLDFYLNGYDINKIKNYRTVEDKTNFFINIIGRRYHSRKLIDSVQRVGTKLTGYPQLIIATFLAASAFTMAAEHIILGTTSRSVRTFIPLDKYVVS